MDTPKKPMQSILARAQALGPMTEQEEMAWNADCNAVMREYFSRQPRIWETKKTGEEGDEERTGNILVPVDRWGNKY